MFSDPLHNQQADPGNHPSTLPFHSSIPESKEEFYQNLIHSIQEDITQLSIGKQEQLADCELSSRSRINISRNVTEGNVQVTLNIPCSIESQSKVSSLPTLSPQSLPQQQYTTNQPHRSPKVHFSSEYEGIQVNKQNYYTDPNEVEQYIQQIARLNLKVLELQAYFTLYFEEGEEDTTPIKQPEYEEYEKVINRLEDEIEEISNRSLDTIDKTNTLKIVRGEDTSILELEEVERVGGNRGIAKFWGSRELLAIDKQTNPAQPQPPFKLMEIQTQIHTLNQQTANQNKYLRGQLCSVVQQLESLKIDYKKLNNLLIEYQIKLSQNRDFYKVKLVDLQRMVKQKTKYLHDLDDEIENTNNFLKDKMRGHETLDSLVSSYSTTIKLLASQFQEQQQKNTQLRRLLDNQMQSHNAEVGRYRQVISDLNKELENQSRCANEVHNELRELKEVNIDLRGVIEKLWGEIKEVNGQYREKEKECSELRERGDDDREQEMEDMKRMIDDMGEEVSELKKDLFERSEELEVLRYNSNQREEEIRGYEEESKLQLYAIERLRKSTEKADDYIEELKSQLMETRSKLEHHQAAASQQQQLDIDFSSLKSKNLVTQLKNMKLSHRNSNFELVLKLIEIIEEYTTDIDSLETQNNQLRGFIQEYENIIEQQLHEIKAIKMEMKEISFHPQEPQSRLGKNSLTHLRKEFQKEVRGYQRGYDVRESEEEEMQIYEELVSQLEHQRKNTVSLTYKLKEAHKELMDYQKEIFQKTEAINYLNLALIKASTSIEEIDDSNSRSVREWREENSELQMRLEEVEQQKLNFQKSIRKIISGKNKEIETLKYQINILDNNVIPELKQENTHYLQMIEKLESDNKKLLKQLDLMSREMMIHDEESRDEKNNLTFEEVKTKKYPYLTLLYIMLRLGETLESTNHVRSFHPQDIYLINFNQSDPQSLKIKLAHCGGQHDNGEFTAPEVINGDQDNYESIAWNYGLILDYIYNKQPYFMNAQQLQTPKIYEKRGKIPDTVKRLIQGLVLKDKKNRLRIEECIQILRLEIQNHV